MLERCDLKQYIYFLVATITSALNFQTSPPLRPLAHPSPTSHFIHTRNSIAMNPNNAHPEQRYAHNLRGSVLRSAAYAYLPPAPARKTEPNTGPRTVEHPRRFPEPDPERYNARGTGYVTRAQAHLQAPTPVNWKNPYLY